MKAVKLSGSVRQGVGKTQASSYRDQGQVPGVIYGGAEQVHIVVKENDLNKFVFTPNVYQFELDIDGKTYKAVLKDIQQHPVTDRVIHYDFQEIVEGKEVKIKIPVRLEGSAIGVRNGGKLMAPNRSLMIQGVPDKFPDEIKVDISQLKIGQSIKVGDLDQSEINILANDNVLIAAVKMARGAVAADEEEEEEGEEGAAEGGDAPAEAAAE